VKNKAKRAQPAKAAAKAANGRDRRAAKSAKAGSKKDSRKPLAQKAGKAQAAKAATAKPVASKAPTQQKGGPDKAASAKTGPAKTAAGKGGDKRSDKAGLKAGLRRELMAGKEAAKRKVAAEATDGPLLDMNDATVKKFIKAAKARGFVTYDELNKVLPSDQNSSEQIEDIMSQLSEMGINVVDSEDEVEDQERESEGGDESEEDGDTPARSKSTALTTTTKDRYDRTDDPVRMYLREMGSVELLSREGEIAIAKRIEAGRDTMIRGLCESPLTFEAIMVWRQELAEERVLLRDIIDLEATYAAAHGGIVDNSQIVLQGGAPPPSTAPIMAKKLAATR
jgi:hypothetical protein